MLFGLFQKRSKVDDDDSASRVTLRVAAFIVKMQIRWARSMGSLFGRLHARMQKYMLIGFIIAGSGYSVWVIVAGFVVKPAPVVSVTAIQQPRYVTNPGDAPAPRTTLIEKDVQVVMAFKRYVDSLSKTANGKWKLDSILKERPGLLDSVEQFSKIYKLKL